MTKVKFVPRPGETVNWSHSCGFWSGETYMVTNQRVLVFHKKHGIKQEYNLRDVQPLSSSFSKHDTSGRSGTTYVMGTLSFVLVSTGANVLQFNGIHNPEYVADLVKAAQRALPQSQPISTSKTCPSCLHTISAVAAYCPKCGNKIP